mgnify:CR=1 FL=1
MSLQNVTRVSVASDRAGGRRARQRRLEQVRHQVSVASDRAGGRRQAELEVLRAERPCQLLLIEPGGAAFLHRLKESTQWRVSCF